MRKNREFVVRNSRSIKSITKEIHGRKDIDSYEFIKFNIPDGQGKYCQPILSMESDYDDISLAAREQIALKVAKRIHHKYRCQVQVVWSGNKSYHVHFRVNRRNLVLAEAKAIQRVLTEEMEEWVRKRFNLPHFVFDRKVTNRLELVRLGDGVRIQTGSKSVKVNQKIVGYWGSDFDNVANLFPMNDQLQEAMKTDAVRKGRSRAKDRGGGFVLPTHSELLDYSQFIAGHGSTVVPSHWGYRVGEDGSKEAVIICFYGPKDRNPSCVLATDSRFTTDTRGDKYPVGWSYQDYEEATQNDFRGASNGLGQTVEKAVPQSPFAFIAEARRSED